MENKEIFTHIDHTLLKADAAWSSIAQLCEEAVRFGMASVCIPPSYVARVRGAYPALTICTVVGFPLGYAVREAKVAEVYRAVLDGVDEIDMVVNLGDVKNGDFDAVTAEIATLKAAADGRVLKVITETCYLTQAEKIALCTCVTHGGADYIKTSTGFGTAGATRADVALFSQHIGAGVKIKAAGGVKTRDDFEAFLALGCERIGTSSAISILAGEGAGAY